MRIFKESIRLLNVIEKEPRVTDKGKLIKNLGSKKASSGVSPSGAGWGRKRRQPRKAME